MQGRAFLSVAPVVESIGAGAATLLVIFTISQRYQDFRRLSRSDFRRSARVSVEVASVLCYGYDPEVSHGAGSQERGGPEGGGRAGTEPDVPVHLGPSGDRAGAGVSRAREAERRPDSNRSPTLGLQG